MFNRYKKYENSGYMGVWKKIRGAAETADDINMTCYK